MDLSWKALVGVLAAQGASESILRHVTERKIDGKSFMTTYWTKEGADIGLSVRDIQWIAEVQRKLKQTGFPTQLRIALSFTNRTDQLTYESLAKELRRTILMEPARVDVYNHFLGLVPMSCIGIDVTTTQNVIWGEVTVLTDTPVTIETKVLALAKTAAQAKKVCEVLRQFESCVISCVIPLDQRLAAMLSSLRLNEKNIIAQSICEDMHRHLHEHMKKIRTSELKIAVDTYSDTAKIKGEVSIPLSLLHEPHITEQVTMLIQQTKIPLVKSIPLLEQLGKDVNETQRRHQRREEPKLVHAFITPARSAGQGDRKRNGNTTGTHQDSSMLMFEKTPVVVQNVFTSSLSRKREDPRYDLAETPHLHSVEIVDLGCR